MKNLSIIAIAIAALGSTPAMAIPLGGSVLHPGRAAIVNIADGLIVPPPIDPDAPPLSQESVQSAVDRKLQKKFSDAARGTNNHLTAQGAKDAGWGVLADHFTEIDSNHDGTLTFDEVQTFLDARSPLPATRARAAKKVQVVE